jgi:hypothetical protein
MNPHGLDMRMEEVKMTVRLMSSLAFLIALAGCEENAGSVIGVNLNQEFSLQIGQEIVVRGEDLTLAFLAVTEDSRCPEGAMCIWAGNGKILVELTKLGAGTVSAGLNTYLEPKKLSYSNYQIYLKELRPYPRVDGRISIDEYAATLVVTK